MARVTWSCLLVSALAVTPAAAQDVRVAATSSSNPPSITLLPALSFSELPDVSIAIPESPSVDAVRSVARPAPRTRPAPLVPMYVSFAGLQALDYHSTTSALSQGIAREANPLARQVVEHPAGFIALKAGATAGMIWASERMWKRHPVQAVVFMAAANTAMAAIVAHNYAIK